MWTFVTAIQELIIDEDGATTVRTAHIFDKPIDDSLGSNMELAGWLNQHGQPDRTYCTVNLIVWRDGQMRKPQIKE